MTGIAETPPPPYVAVIFTSTQTDDLEGYQASAERMEELAKSQPGYLGFESARGELGIAVSYWSTDDDARAWKQVAEHAEVQRIGRARWYASYRVRVARVEREYGSG